MKTFPKKRAAVAAGLAMCAVSFSAAAGATNGSSPGYLAAGAASAAPILVGDVCDCSGAVASSDGGWAPGAEVWKKWVNAHGGIDGHQVDIFEADTQSNTADVIPAIKQLVENDHVVAIIPGSTFAATFASLVQADGIPEVGGFSTSADFSTNPVFFPASTTETGQLLGIIGAGVKAGKKKLGVFVPAGASSAFTPIVKPIAQQLGADFLRTEELSDSAPNYAAQCLAMQGSGVNNLVLLLTAATAIRAAQDCAAQGYHPTYVASTSTVTKAMLSVPALDGLLFEEPNAPFFAKSPALSQFNAAMAKYNAGFLHSPLYGEDTLQAWISGLLLQAAIEAQMPKGSVTSADITKGMYKLHSTTLGGLAPPLSFVANTPRQFNCYFIGELHHGKFTAPFGTKAICQSS